MSDDMQNPKYIVPMCQTLRNQYFADLDKLKAMKVELDALIERFEAAKVEIEYLCNV